MTIALITAPSTEPLSLAEVKAHLRIEHDHEDQLLGEVLSAARQHTEFCSGQKLITQSWRQYENCLPDDGAVVLKIAPVQSVTAVTLYNADGSPQVLAAQDYTLMRGVEPATLMISDSIGPKSSHNGLEIDLVVGFGDFSIDVPDTLKRAILLLTAHWYEFRGAVSPENQPVSIPAGFENLMRPFRRVQL